MAWLGNGPTLHCSDRWRSYPHGKARVSEVKSCAPVCDSWRTGRSARYVCWETLLFTDAWDFYRNPRSGHHTACRQSGMAPGSHKKLATCRSHVREHYLSRSSGFSRPCGSLKSPLLAVRRMSKCHDSLLLNNHFGCIQTFSISMSEIEHRASGSRSIAVVRVVGSWQAATDPI